MKDVLEFCSICESTVLEAVHSAANQGRNKDLDLLFSSLVLDMIRLLVRRFAILRALPPTQLGCPSVRSLIARGLPARTAERWIRTVDGLIGSEESGESGPEPEWLGHAFEVLYGKQVLWESQKVVVCSHARRRDEGVFFTPLATVRALVDEALRAATGNVLGKLAFPRVLDPATGGGFFLLETARWLWREVRATGKNAALRRRVIMRSIHGIDVNPHATWVASALLWLETSDPTLHFEHVKKRIACMDVLLNEPPWARRFDVVLGNPPWGKIKPDFKEFFGQFDNGVRFLQGQALRDGMQAAHGKSRQNAWRHYVATKKDYASCLRESGRFRAQTAKVRDRSTSSDPDLYKYFLERAYQLTGKAGCVALIVPAAFGQTEGATGLRRLYLETGTFSEFHTIENRRLIFPIHSMFRFVMFVYKKGRVDGIRRASFGSTSPLVISHLAKRRERCKHLRLTGKTLKAIGTDLMTIPEIRSTADLKLLTHLHSMYPPLGASEGHWHVTFRRELDMTNDSKLFKDSASLLKLGAVRSGSMWETPGGESFLPLYEGRMVHQFDHTAKSYLKGEGRTAQWTFRVGERSNLTSHYYVAESDLRPELRARVREPRAGFCDVTGHANERTVLAALIPAGCVCGNKVPTCDFEPGDEALKYVWLGLANSLVVDWLVRRRISTTLNYFVWSQVPFPRLAPDSPSGSVLARLSLALCNQSLVHDGWERGLLRAELDAEVAALYGLEPENFAILLADFPLLDRRQPKVLVYKGRTLTITGALALSSLYRRLDQPVPAELSDRIHRQRQLGATPYIPSERYRGLCNAGVSASVLNPSPAVA